MEKKLTKYDLLKGLIKKAFSPFTTSETIQDIKHILETSHRFDGLNHLYLVACYLEDDTRLFYVDYKRAVEQLNIALSEHCDVAYYYQYLLYKKTDKNKARIGLHVMSELNYGPALLALAKEYENGELFEKDENKAMTYYQKAMDAKEIDAYINGILLAKKNNDKTTENKIYQKAVKNKIDLPGIVE